MRKKEWLTLLIIERKWAGLEKWADDEILQCLINDYFGGEVTLPKHTLHSNHQSAITCLPVKKS